MFKSIIAILAMLPIAAFAAGDTGSEFFHQAGEGKSELTPNFRYMSGTYKLVGGTATDITETNLSATYEYGLMPELSIGAKLSYKSLEYKTGATTNTESGLENIDLIVKASMPAGPGALKYGATLSLSPGNSVNETNGDTNAYTGGHSLTPYFGYEYSMDPCIFGAQLSTEVGLTDKTSEAASGTETAYSGNEETTLSLFYEHKFSEDMRIGAQFDWVTTSDTKNETSGGPATEAISPTQNLFVYLPTTMGSGVLLPSVGYHFTTDDKDGTTKIDTYSMYLVNVGYRLTF